MEKLRVIVACEESQTVCKAFRSISKKESSKTFGGIAEAMAIQWSEYVLQNNK